MASGENSYAAGSLGQDSLLGDGFDDFEDFDDFDPLAADDISIDQDEMDDENPYDTVDYPTMREMPKHMQREAVFTPEVQGSADAAIRGLFDHNPARRRVFLSIIDICRDGCVSSVISKKVDAVQNDNRSVYAPMTLCRMLERAGALDFEPPVVADEMEDIEANVEYLEIREVPDPVWTSTEAGLAIYDEMSQGAEFRDIVLDRDSKYLEVYKAVFDLMLAGPQQRQAIEELVDTFDIVKSPRRFGGHFIDMLERTDAISWKDNAWTITDLGRSLYGEVVVGIDDARVRAAVENEEKAEEG